MAARRAAAAAALGLLVVLGRGAASAAPKDFAPLVVLVAPDAGPDAATGAELELGIRAALGSGTVADPKAAFRRDALPSPGKSAELAASWKGAAPALVLAWAPDGRVGDLEDLARRSGAPTVVLSPEAARPSVDVRHPVLWAGGVRTADEALQAMDFLLLPVGSRRPAILHDGGARGADAARRCLRLHHFSQDPMQPAAVGDAFDAPDVAALAAAGADAIAYFGGAAGAERLLRASADARSKLPVVLGQGLGGGSVPTFAEGRAAGAWALEAEWFEDHGEVARDDRAILADAEKAAGAPRRAASVRGYRAGRWALDALREAGAADPKKVLPALRALARPGARGKRVFDDHGAATLARLGPWRSAAERDEPACRRVRPTEVPMQAIPQVGTFDPSRFEWEEGTVHVECTWLAGAERTIEKDLQGLGLATGGYEKELEERILDDLMGRFLSRMNRLFLRNPDGTSVPGVSYRISFTTGPAPKQAKGPKLKAFLAGDDPSAGGRASGSTANIFSTFIQRTIYLSQALAPPLSAADRPHLAGTYRWGTSVDRNVRDGLVRALVDGYSQGLSLTGAHEVGHLCGLGHDTESPRSLMNVVEAVGLDFDWAEWIPSHATVLERTLGRVPPTRD